MTDTTAQTIAQTALTTAAALAPQLAAADPKVAAILAAATLANNLLQAATAAAQAGVLPTDQLPALFASIGPGVMATHNTWIAMNAADAAAKASGSQSALASFNPAAVQQPPFTPAAGYAHSGV